jgi:hypothetical protein
VYILTSESKCKFVVLSEDLDVELEWLVEGDNWNEINQSFLLPYSDKFD